MKEIKESVEILQRIIQKGSLFDLQDLMYKEEIEGIKTVIALCQSHIAAVEGGVPEERECKEHSTYCADCSRCNSNGDFNEARSLMLPLVVDRDNKIAELEKQKVKDDDFIKRQFKAVEELQSRRTVGVSSEDIECLRRRINELKLDSYNKKFLAVFNRIYEALYAKGE
jgi:hypothetical protein